MLTNTDTGRLTGYYVYYPKDNLSSLVIVDPLNRGTGAVDILFEDMKRRIAKNDPNFKIHAKIYRASPRVPLSKIGNFFGTIDERKKALGIRSSVTVIPYADPDLMIEPVTEPLKYSTKSLPMRYPQLYDLITEYLHGLASETPVDVLMMGAGLDERFLEEYPASPQTVEVIASLADREANLKIIDVNETVHSIIREPKYYLWYKTFEGSRKLRNEYRDSTSYEVMKQNLAGVLKDAGPDDFEWDSGATKEKVYRVDLSELQDIQIETVLSEFSAVEDYGIESQNIIISTIALAYDLMRMNMDQRNQFIAKLARALKPGGVMIVHADEFVLMHPDLSEYPFHLRNDQVIKIGFSDVQKMLKKMTGSDFQLQLYGPLVEIKKSAPVKKSSQIGARLSESNSQTESNKTQRSFQKPGFTNYFMGAIVAGTHLLLMESLVALTFDLNSIFMTVMFSALFGVNLFRTIVEILNGQKILPGRLIDYPQSMHYAISRWQNFTWPALLVFSYVGFANTDIDFITIRTDSFNSRTIGISMMTALATYYILQPLMLKMNVKNAFDPRPYWRPREANFTVRSKAVSFYNSVIKASIYEEIERYIQIYAYTSILSSYIGSSAAWGAALWLSTAHFWALHEGRKNRMHSIVGLINGVILISFQSIWLPILIHSVLNLRHVLESEKRVIQQIKKFRKKVIQNKFSKELDLKIRYDDFEEGRSKIVFQKTISGEETMRIKMLPGSVFLSPDKNFSEQLSTEFETAIEEILFNSYNSIIDRFTREDDLYSEDGRIKIRLHTDDDNIYIEIEDNGLPFELNPEGIPGKRQRGRFHVGGDGRGIPYLLSFSKAYGGNIKWIKRAGGTGTITRLSLPLGLVPPSFKSGSVEKLNGARLTFQDSDHVLSHPSDYFQETLGQFVSERLGNGNVIDIGGDGNFIRLTASDLASEGVQLNEIYSMDIASLKRINPSDKDGVFEAQTLLGQDHPLRRLKVEPAAQVLEEKFSLMFMNAPVLEGASLGKGGFRDWVYDAKFFGAEDAVLLVRLHTDDIRNGRIGRFVSVLNGSSQESVNPANPSYGPVADMLGIVPFEGRNYQLTDFHTHMPQKMLTTPYTSNSPVPIVEFKRTDSVSDSQKKSLAGKITGIVLETKNAQIRSVGLGLLITLRDYAGDFVIAEADRFRKIYDRAVSEPYTDTVRGDIQILFDAYGLPVSGARLAGPEEILIDPSDAEARSAWESKSDAASKLGPFSLSALAAKKLNISDRFYELLTDAGLIPQGQQELSSIASLITNPYELDAWQHLLDAAIQNPDNFYERIEPYFSNDFARQSNSWITVDTQTHRFSGTGYSVFSVNQMWSDNTIPLSEKIMMTLTLLGTEEVDRNYTFSRAVLELAKNISFSDSEGLLAVKTQTKILAEELREYIRAFIISKTAPYTKDLALYHGTPYSTDSDESIFSRPDTVYLTPLKDEASEYGDGGVLYKLQVPIDSIVDVSGWGTSEWEFIAAAESEGGGYSVLEKTDLSEPGSRLSADTQNLKDRIASVERTIRTFRYLGVSRFMTLWRKTASDDQKKEIFRRAMSFKSAQDRQWSYDQTFGWEKVHVKKLQRNILIAAGIGISAFWIPYTAYTLIPLGVNSIFLHIYPVLMQKYIRKRIERINLKEQLKEAEMRDSGSRLSDRSVADMVISDPYSISKILITINSWARAGKLYTHQEGTTYFGGSADEGVRENIFAITVPIFHYAFYRMSENGLPSLPLEYVYEDSESGPKITLTLSSYERDSTLFRMADIAVKNLSETFGFDVNTSQTDEGFKFEINIPSKKIFNSRSSRSSLGSLNVQTGMYPLTLEVKKYLEEIRRSMISSSELLGLVNDFVYSGPEILLTRERHSGASVESFKFVLTEFYINALNSSATVDVSVSQQDDNWIIEIENPGQVNFDALYDLAEHYARNDQFRKYRNKSGYLVPPDPTDRYETEYHSGDSEVVPADQALDILKKMREENPSDILWIEYLTLKSLTASEVIPDASLRGKQIGGAGRGILNASIEIRKIFRGDITVHNSENSVIVKVMIPSGIQKRTEPDSNLTGARLASPSPEQTTEPALRKITPAPDSIAGNKTEYRLPLFFSEEPQRINDFFAEAGFQKRSEIQKGFVPEFPLQAKTSLLRIRFSGLSEAEIHDFSSGSVIATLNISARKNGAADPGYQLHENVDRSDSEFTAVDDAVSIDIQTAGQIEQIMSEYGVGLKPVNFILNTDHYLGMFDADQREVMSRNLMRIFSEMNRRNLASFSFEGKSAAEYGFKDFSPYENAPSVYFWNLNKFDSVDADTRINLPYFEQSNGMIPVYTTVTAASAIANLKEADQIPPGLLEELNEIFRKLTRSNAVLNQDTLKVLWKYYRDAGQDVYKLLSVKPFTFRGFIDASVYLQKLIRHYVDTSA